MDWNPSKDNRSDIKKVRGTRERSSDLMLELLLLFPYVGSLLSTGHRGTFPNKVSPSSDD